MLEKKAPGSGWKTRRSILWIVGIMVLICVSALLPLFVQSTIFARQAEKGQPAGNNRGISNNRQTRAANYDGNGNSYSAQALQAAGFAPGKALTVQGFHFVWPGALPGQNDNYQAHGQSIHISSFQGAQTLAFLGSSTHGPAQGLLRLIYNDGSTQLATLRFSDWTLNGGKGQLLSQNQVAATMSYRNTSSGHENVKTYLFSARISLQAGKTLTRITLPGQVDRGQLHIFAWSTDHRTDSATPAATPTSKPTATPTSGITATVGITKTPTPAPTPASTPPPVAGCSTFTSCGFPNASNTGVPAGTKLTARTGNISITQDGEVINGVDLNGSFDVYANNVTIENCRITSANWWGINLRQGYSGLKVLHCTITGLVGQGQDNGGEDYAISNMGNGNIEVAFNNISEFGDALSLSHGSIHDNYVHDLQSFIALDGHYEHTDDIISDGDDPLGLVIRHNTLLNQMTTAQGASAAVGLFADDGPVSHSTVDNNWIAGGSYALYAGGSGATSIVITNNIFSTQYWSGCGYYGPVAYWNAGGAGNVFTGNRFVDGTPVSPAS